MGNSMKFRGLMTAVLILTWCYIPTHAHEPPAGLLLHLPFDGSLANQGSAPGAGELIAKGGEPAGGGAEFREGRIGQAIYFPGDVAVRVPFDLNLELYPQGTITAWVYPEGEMHGYVLSNRSNAGPTLSLSKSGVSARATTAQPGKSGILRPGRWTFVAAAWDTQSNTLRLQYDRRVETAEMSDRMAPAAMDIWIGAWDDSLNSPLENVRVDEVRIYGRALTADELEGLWLDGYMAGSSNQPARSAGEPTTVSSINETLTGRTSRIGTSGRVTTDADAIESARAGESEPAVTTGTVTTDAEALIAAREAGSGGDSGTTGKETNSSDELTTTRQGLEPQGGWRLSTTDYYESTVAGSQGAVKRVLEPTDGKALTKIGWGLKNKLPCRLYVESRNGGRKEAGTCAGDSYNATREAELGSGYITKVVVGERALNDSLDSLAIEGYVFDASGQRGIREKDESVDPDAPIHNVSSDSATCREGYVGSGVGGYFERKANDNTRLVGLSLICSKIVLTNQ